jgi:PST family polysaccharide transporter
MALGLPLLVGENLLAGPAIRMLLGEHWLGAVPLLQWLSLSLVPALFALAANPLVMALGETRIFFKRNTLELCVKLPILIGGGIAFGFAGIVVARMVAEVIAALYCVHAVRRLIGISVREQLLGPWRSFVAVLVMAPVVIVCVGVLDPGEGTAIGSLQSCFNLIAMIGAGAATYGAAILSLWLLTGRPQGVEAMAVDAVAAIVTRARRLA